MGHGVLVNDQAADECCYVRKHHWEKKITRGSTHVPTRAQMLCNQLVGPMG